MEEIELLRIEHLSKTFQGRAAKKQKIYAVNDVSLTVAKGESLGIVGESGCGKSTMARLIIGTYPPDKGTIFLNGQKVTGLSKKEQRTVSRQIQMVFQNPISSFSPRMTIGDYLYEPLRNFEKLTRKEAQPKIARYMKEVGLPVEFTERYPHELSGGQLQRIAIARAAIIEPSLIVCDEATSALDVSVQRQVIELLEKLRLELGLSYLFIGHDLALVQKITQRIAVMYLGKIVEILPSELLKSGVSHPYTKALLNSVFDVYESREEEKKLISGDPPSPMELHKGCSFASRCPFATERCRREEPGLRKIEERHFSACHLV